MLADRVTQSSDLFAQARKLFHVALATLDFLVQNNAIESFFPLEQFAGQVEVSTHSESEPINVLLHHVLRFLDAFGNLDFLLPGQQRHLAHLLEIHPHRVIERVQPDLCLLFIFFFVVRVFLTVLVAIHF